MICKHCHGSGTATDWIDYGNTAIRVEVLCEYCDGGLVDDPQLGEHPEDDDEDEIPYY